MKKHNKEELEMIKWEKEIQRYLAIGFHKIEQERRGALKLERDLIKGTSKF